MKHQNNDDNWETTIQGEERLFTVPDAARALSISESFLRHLIQKKQIPGILRIGRAVRFDPRALRIYKETLIDEARNL